MKAAKFLLRSMASKALDVLDVAARSIKQPSVRCDVSCGVRRTVFDGNNTVNARSRVVNSRIGRYTYIAPDCLILNVSIGAFCSIGPGVYMGLGRHPSRGWISTSPCFYSPVGQAGNAMVDTLKFQETAPIAIGNDVWIGARAMIADSVTVGDGALIGAGAVVTENVPPYAVCAGVPGRILRYRYSEAIIERLTRLKWWSWTESELRKAAPLFEHALDYQDIEDKLDALESLAASRPCVATMGVSK